MGRDLPPAPADGIVINQSAAVLHGTWAFLVVLAAAGTWGIIPFVDDATTENRIAVVVAGAVLIAMFVAIWIYQATHPSRLEISQEKVVERKRRGGPIVIERSTGELVIEPRGSGRSVGLILRGPDEASDEEVIWLTHFDQREVRRACEAVGWHFAPRG